MIIKLEKIFKISMESMEGLDYLDDSLLLDEEDFISNSQKTSPGHRSRYLNVGGVFVYAVLEADMNRYVDDKSDSL